MRSPMQAVPVQRAMVSYSSADAKGAAASFTESGNGVVASAESGIQPSDLFGDIMGGLGGVLKTLPMLGLP